jgi:hypothetical protein
MAQPKHKLLDLSTWSFDALTQQLPAAFPADWGQRSGPSMGSHKSILPLTLCWDGRELLIQIMDDSWMVELKKSCGPAGHGVLEHSQNRVRLDKMVLLIYQLLDRTNICNKETLYGVWRDMKAVLLLWAIGYRTQNMMEAYHMLFPFAYIGELVTINKGVQGYLCNWSPQEGIKWDCKISQQGMMLAVEIPWQELLKIPHYVQSTGEMGKLLGELLTAAKLDSGHVN